MWLTSLLATALMSACGGGQNTLGGSVGELLSLQFSETSITREGSTLVIDYLNSLRGGDPDITARLSITLDGFDPKQLSELSGNEFMSSVFLQRATRDNDRFPATRSGKVTFHDLDLGPTGHVSGRFSVVFTDGRSLSGSFDGDFHE